jgi:polyhydroxybutyrate depolymerase
VTRIPLVVRGEPREYLLFSAAAADRPLPLVLVLHGAGGTGEWADGETGWSAVAAREGFALALPEGTRPHPEKPARFLANPPRWNDGSPGPGGEPSTADDVAFLAAVIDDVMKRIDVDPRRVYVTGFSNGAGMAFRAAADLADQVAAVAPVAGYCWLPDPKPVRPVPTLYLIGSADPLVPLRGGEVRSPWLHRLVRRPPVAESLEKWATAIGCDTVPRVESETNGVRVEAYPGPVEFRSVVIDGLGHHWPGGKGQLNPRIAGPPSGRFGATTEVWAFFRRQAVG